MTIQQDNSSSAYSRIKELDIAESCVLNLREYKYTGLKTSVYNISRNDNKKFKIKQLVSPDGCRVLVVTRIK